MYMEEIEIIKAVNESKSLSQAADKLHMSRPSLSQKISMLEKSFGTQLFERTPQGVKPTRSGLMLYEYAKRVSQMSDELMVELASLGESFTPDVSIGISLADGVELIPPLVMAYRGEHPDVTFHLDAGYEPMLYRKLIDSVLDFALVEDRTMESALHKELLGQEELIIVAPNCPPYSRMAQPIKYSKLLPLPMIIYEWNSGRHMVGNRHFRVYHNSGLTDNNIVARMDTHEAMIKAVKAGLGWSSFPKCIWNRYKDDPSMIEIKIDTSAILYDVSLATVADRPLSPVAQDFYNFVKANIDRQFFVKD